MMQQEFRRAPRRRADAVISVCDAMTGQVVGRVGNLSETGMLLMASTALVPDGLYQLRFSLPGADGTGQPLELGAHLLWADQASAPGQSWVGLRFIGLDEHQATALRRWVRAAGATLD